MLKLRSSIFLMLSIFLSFLLYSCNFQKENKSIEEITLFLSWVNKLEVHKDTSVQATDFMLFNSYFKKGYIEDENVAQFINSDFKNKFKELQGNYFEDATEIRIFPSEYVRNHLFRDTIEVKKLIQNFKSDTENYEDYKFKVMLKSLDFLFVYKSKVILLKPSADTLNFLPQQSIYQFNFTPALRSFDINKIQNFSELKFHSSPSGFKDSLTYQYLELFLMTKKLISQVRTSMLSDTVLQDLKISKFFQVRFGDFLKSVSAKSNISKTIYPLLWIDSNVEERITSLTKMFESNSNYVDILALQDSMHVLQKEFSYQLYKFDLPGFGWLLGDEKSNQYYLFKASGSRATLSALFRTPNDSLFGHQFIRDINFDGVEDIGLFKSINQDDTTVVFNIISNTEGYSFQYIGESFKNPVLDNKNKIIMNLTTSFKDTTALGYDYFKWNGITRIPVANANVVTTDQKFRVTICIDTVCTTNYYEIDKVPHDFWEIMRTKFIQYPPALPTILIETEI